MGCGCGGKKGTKTTWLFTSPNGEQRIVRSQVEARAEQIRAGGGTIVAKQS